MARWRWRWRWCGRWILIAATGAPKSFGGDDGGAVSGVSCARPPDESKLLPPIALPIAQRHTHTHTLVVVGSAKCAAQRNDDVDNYK
uniref:Putative secreted protein n=1 Tax=Anopheles darlingi TaxID=43151 RepID=A0A2M4DQZ6_ANODA